MKTRFVLVTIVLAVLASACSHDATTTTGAVSPPVAAATSAAPVETAVPDAAAAATTAPATAVPTTAVAVAAAPDTGFPVQVEHDSGVADVQARPERIAALSATHVEMLFAIGAGSQVIAGDLFTNYPPGELGDLALIDSFNLSVEAVIEIDPDLVILSFDPGDAVAAFEAVGIPTLLLGTAADLEEVYSQIEVLGQATGQVSEAETLASNIQGEVAAITSQVGTGTGGLTFYHESDPFSFYTPNSSSFIGRLYELLGMVNIADAAPDEFNSGFPQLSAEFIVASDPDIIFLASFGESFDTLIAREGWDTMSALQAGNVIVLDYDAASRWGPRVVDLLRSIADATATVVDG